jgi:LysM repeat protein
MGINVTKESVKVKYVIGKSSVVETLEQTLDLPSEKPFIERVLDVTPEITGSVSASVGDNGFIEFNENNGAAIALGVTYVAAEEDQPVHYFSSAHTGDYINLTDLENTITIPEAEPGMEVEVDVDFIEVDYEAVATDMALDQVIVDLTIKVTVKVIDHKEFEIITGIEGIDPSCIMTEDLVVEDIVLDKDYQRQLRDNSLEIEEDVERVLKVDGAIIKTKEAEINDTGVRVQGDFQVRVLYVAGGSDQPVHVTTATFEIDEDISIPELTEDSNIYVDISLKDWDYDTSSTTTGERVDVDAIVNINIKLTDLKEITVVTGVESDKIELEKELLRVDEIIGDQTLTDTFTEVVSAPAPKPNIKTGGILETDINYLAFDCSAEENEVKVSGTYNTGVMYIADETIDGNTAPVHYFHDELNYAKYINFPGSKVGMNCDIDVMVKRITGRKVESNEVRLSITLQQDIRVTDLKELEIITDIIEVSPVVDEPDADQPAKVVYVVQPGDTLYKIACRYKTTIDAIVDANNISNPNYLEVGQKLIIPRKIIGDCKG